MELLKQRGMDIYWTFFLEQSPLPLDVEQGAKDKICEWLDVLCTHTHTHTHSHSHSHTHVPTHSPLHTSLP